MHRLIFIYSDCIWYKAVIYLERFKRIMQPRLAFCFNALHPDIFLIISSTHNLVSLPSNPNTSRKHAYTFFYKVKLGFTGVYIIFLISAQKLDRRYLLEGEFQHSMFWAEMWKISEFLSENFQVLVVKFSIHLNRRVFVMRSKLFLDEKLAVRMEV